MTRAALVLSFLLALTGCQGFVLAFGEGLGATIGSEAVGHGHARSSAPSDYGVVSAGMREYETSAHTPDWIHEGEPLVIPLTIAAYSGEYHDWCDAILKRAPSEKEPGLIEVHASVRASASTPATNADQKGLTIEFVYGQVALFDLEPGEYVVSFPCPNQRAPFKSWQKTVVVLPSDY